MPIDKLPFQLTGTLQIYNRMWWKRQPREYMITSGFDEKKAIFVHIPKTAGTSIFKVLGLDPAVDTHATALCYRDKDPVFFAEAFKFSFVRSPWGRLVSSFNFLKSGTVWPMQQEWAARHIGDMSLEEFLTKYERSLIFRNIVNAERFFWPQSYWLMDRSGQLLVDAVYRFEHIEAGIDSVCQQLGISRPPALPHARKGQISGTYREQFTPRMVDTVARMYRSDIDAFGYSFDE